MHPETGRFVDQWQSPLMRARHFVGILSVLIALVAAGGCSSEPVSPPLSKKSSPTAVPSVDPTVNYANPQAVCERLARTIFTRNAVIDPTEGESYRRTRPYMTAKAYGRDGGASQGRNSSTWQQWVDHRARTEIAVEPFIGDGLDSEPDQQASGVTVHVTPKGADGWQGPTVTYNMFCTLTQLSRQWRVAHYDTEELTNNA